MDGLVSNHRHDGVMLANIVVQDRAHLGFRVIYETANIRFLSGVIWGKSWGDEMATLLTSRDSIRQMTAAAC